MAMKKSHPHKVAQAKPVHHLVAHPAHHASAKSAVKKYKKLKTGIKGFDELFTEGIPEGSAVLVEGGPGSGKTIICLNMTNNFCRQGKKVLYMSFEEPAGRLIDHMTAFGWDPEKYIANKQLVVKRFDALDIARSVEALLSAAKKELLIEVQPMLFPRDFQPDIVLIDSLTSIASAFSGEESRFRIYMEQLFRYLESANITSFLIRETASPTHIGSIWAEKGEAVSFLADGIVAIYNVYYTKTGYRGTAIEVLKMRGESIKRKIVEAEITNKGILVFANKQLKGDYRLT